MNLYTILNLLIIVPALALSFDRRVAFRRSWACAGAAILAVGTVFVLWDIAVTKVGHWDFSPEYAGSGRIFGLPAGEIIFFISVPFACIFILEVARAYFRERIVAVRPLPFALSAGASLVAAVALKDHGYTFIVLGSLALTLALIAGPARRLFSRSSTWQALALSYIPFMIFNGIFTALPIVTYHPEMILGPRIISIPVEDFTYSFSLISLSYMAFDACKVWRARGRSV